MNCWNHLSLVLFTVYRTVHHHCHRIPLSFPSSCAPRTSGLVLRSLPGLSPALNPSTLDFFLTPPLPWVPLGAKYLASPLPFNSSGQVYLTLLVLPAVLSSLQCDRLWSMVATCSWPFSAEDAQNSMARNPCPHVSFAAPTKWHVTRSYRPTRISKEAEHQVEGTTGSQWRGNQMVKGDVQPFLGWDWQKGHRGMEDGTTTWGTWENVPPTVGTLVSQLEWCSYDTANIPKIYATFSHMFSVVCMFRFPRQKSKCTCSSKILWFTLYHTD